MRLNKTELSKYRSCGALIIKLLSKDAVKHHTKIKLGKTRQEATTLKIGCPIDANVNKRYLLYLRATFNKAGIPMKKRGRYINILEYTCKIPNKDLAAFAGLLKISSFK